MRLFTKTGEPVKSSPVWIYVLCGFACRDPVRS